VRVFGHTPHRLIYPVKQLADKVLGSHAVSPFRCIGVATRSLGAPHGAFQEPLKLAPFVTMPCQMTVLVWIFGLSCLAKQ
jgi:hypothetical protein